MYNTVSACLHFVADSNIAYSLLEGFLLYRVGVEKGVDLVCWLPI